MKHLLLPLLYSLTLVSCNLALEVEQLSNNQTSAVYASKIKKCKIEQNLQNPNVQVAVKTNYTAKVSTITSLNSAPSIRISVEEKDIRYANYRILNAAGAIVYCGNTGANGLFNLTLKENETYTIKVYSYILFSTIANVAIMNSPAEASPYFIQKSFNTSDTTSLQLVSKLPENSLTNLETNNSGAFNILDQIVTSNLFLKTNTQNCTTCTSSFSNTPFLEIYWKLGLNPRSYLNDPNTPVSFFLNFREGNTHYYRIFILGGMNGISDAITDTDEFDNSVIIHEYAHFLMSVFSKDSNPGGLHYAVESIDPRLAWSEGIANFFQAAVLNEGVYLDITGSSAINIPFEKQNGASTKDKPSIRGEGNYREFSIARFFWDIIDSNSNYNSRIDDDNYLGTAADFQWIWDVITSPAFKSNSIASMGLFNEVQNFNLTSNSIPWNDLRDLHLQHNPADLFFQSLYGLQLSPNCNSLKPALQFIETQLATIENNYMVQKKRVLEYNHRSTGPVLLGLKNNPVADKTEPLIKFYIQQSNVPMQNRSPHYIYQSTSNTNCTAQDYNQCLNVSLKKGRYLIEVVLQDNIAENSRFQFFANEEELCGEHTTYANLTSEPLTFNHKTLATSKPLTFNNRTLATSKLTSPFDLSLKALKQEAEETSIYQIEATFLNKNLHLNNLKLQWQHSGNIKIISGNVEETIASVTPQKQIKMKLLIQAIDPLDKINIYLLAKAHYKDREFPKTLAFTLKQLINQSKPNQNQKLLFQKNTASPIPQNTIIRY